MDTERIRTDFPILEGGLVYLDNAATSLTPEPVVQAVLEYYHDYRANIHRGVHQLSMRASEEYESAHKKIGSLIGARPEEIVLTMNSTHSINLIALALDWKKGDKVVLTELEHHSNYMPWLRLRNKHGVDLEILRPNKDGTLNVDDFSRAAEGARLITVQHVSNVLGTVAPVKEIGKVAKENGCLFLVDGAQSVPHIPVDVRKTGCDFLAFSSHKMLGPTGVGVLFMRKGLSDEISPPIVGGGTPQSMNSDGYVLARMPDRWEAGTPNIAGAIGLGRATEYLQALGMENIKRHEDKLTKMALEGLNKLPKVEIYGTENRIGVISFNVKGMHAHDVAGFLDNHGKIEVRSGHHCCLPLMRFLGVEGTVRASFYVYNTEKEIQKFLNSVEEVCKIAP